MCTRPVLGSAIVAQVQCTRNIRVSICKDSFIAVFATQSRIGEAWIILNAAVFAAEFVGDATSLGK